MPTLNIAEKKSKVFNTQNVIGLSYFALSTHKKLITFVKDRMIAHNCIVL